jgi:hypothetical protein
VGVVIGVVADVALFESNIKGLGVAEDSSSCGVALTGDDADGIAAVIVRNLLCYSLHREFIAKKKSEFAKPPDRPAGGWPPTRYRA